MSALVPQLAYGYNTEKGALIFGRISEGSMGQKKVKNPIL